jgi:hypothetical protein|tara:strand:+ start:11508 stop:12029 length:522 start_codon:yes stop_codon:yes gene_type:complete
MSASLSFIKKGSGYDLSALDITNCFSSAYDVYQLNVISYVNSDLSAYFWIQYLDSGGSAITQAEYTYGYENMTSYTSNYSATNYVDNTAILTGYGESDPDDSSSSTIMIFSPYDSSSYTFATHDISSQVKGYGGAGIKGASVHKSTEQLSGLRLFAQGSNTMNYIEANIFGVD